jgi:hypothetical protein
LTCSFQKSFESNVEFIICLNIGNRKCVLKDIVPGGTSQYQFSATQINENLYQEKVCVIIIKS